MLEDKDLFHCFEEVIAYTLFLVSEQNETKLEYDLVINNYFKFIEHSKACILKLGFNEKLWEKILLPISAWIDEIILCSNITIKEKWSHKQLQRHYLNTTNAGELFYTELDKLNDEGEANIKNIYEICIGLGFVGCGCVKKNNNYLLGIRQRVLEAVKKKYNLSLPNTIFSDAYDENKHLKKRKNISIFSVIIIVLSAAIVCGLYIFSSISLDNELQSLLKLNF